MLSGESAHRPPHREMDWRRGTSLVCMTADRSLIARLACFERQVDPDGVLPPDERARRARHARKAYFARLALRSAQARRKASGASDEVGRSSRPDEDRPE